MFNPSDAFTLGNIFWIVLGIFIVLVALLAKKTTKEK